MRRYCFLTMPGILKSLTLAVDSGIIDYECGCCGKTIFWFFGSLNIIWSDGLSNFGGKSDCDGR